MLKKQFRMKRRNHKMGILKQSVFIGLIAGLILSPARAQVVQVQELSDFSPSAYGIPIGQPIDLWSVSNPKLIYKLLDKVSEKSLKPSEAERLVRLLSADTGYFVWPEFQQSDAFLIKRLQTLLKIGAFETVEQVIQSVPVAHRSADLLALWVDVLILQGKTKEAFALLDRESQIPHSEQKRMAALLAQDDFDNARLLYELYREQNPTETDFVLLADAVFRDRPLPKDKQIQPSVENIFLLMRLKKVESQKAGWIRAVLNRFKPDLLTPTALSDTIDVKRDLTGDNLLKIADLTPESKTVYPFDMYRALGQAAGDGRRGEAVLWAVLLLSESDFYRVEITRVMNDMMSEISSFNQMEN